MRSLSVSFVALVLLTQPGCSRSTPTQQARHAAASETREKYRAVTEADGLSCKFSQDISTSMGIELGGLAGDDYIDPTPPKSGGGGFGLSGTMWSKANHLKCTDKSGKEIEIALLNKTPNLHADIKDEKLVLRTRDYGTVYRTESGKTHTFEMTETQIKRLKTFLGF